MLLGGHLLCNLLGLGEERLGGEFQLFLVMIDKLQDCVYLAFKDGVKGLDFRHVPALDVGLGILRYQIFDLAAIGIGLGEDDGIEEIGGTCR